MEYEEVKSIQDAVQILFFAEERQDENIPTFEELLRSIPKKDLVDLETLVFGTKIRVGARQKKTTAKSLRTYLERHSLDHSSHQKLFTSLRDLCKLNLDWVKQQDWTVLEGLKDQYPGKPLSTLREMINDKGQNPDTLLHIDTAKNAGKIYETLIRAHAKSIEFVARKPFGSLICALQDTKIPYQTRLGIMWACITSEEVTHNLAAQYARQPGYEIDFTKRQIELIYNNREALDKMAVQLIKENVTFHYNVEELRSKFIEVQGYLQKLEDNHEREIQGNINAIQALEKERDKIQGKLDDLGDKAGRLQEIEDEKNRLQEEYEEKNGSLEVELAVAISEEKRAWILSEECIQTLFEVEEKNKDLQARLQDANQWMAMQSRQANSRGDNGTGYAVANPVLEMALQRKGYSLELFSTIVGVMLDNGNGKRPDRLKSLVNRALGRKPGVMKRYKKHFSILELEGVVARQPDSSYVLCRDPSGIGDEDIRSLADSMFYAAEQRVTQ